MQVSTILVLGGLYIGDLDTPYRNNATIRLFGDRAASGLVYNGVDFGTKVRAMKCYPRPSALAVLFPCLTPHTTYTLRVLLHEKTTGLWYGFGITKL